MTINEKRAPLPVLFMIDRLGVAGTEKWLLRLIERIDNTKIRPHLCLLDGLDSESQRLIPAGVPTLCLGLRSFWSIKTFFAMRRLYRFLREQGIQVVQVHFPDSTFFGAAVAWSAGVRRIIGTMRNTGYWATIWQRFRMRIAGRFLTNVIANSHASAIAARGIFKISDSKIAVIHNGIDIPQLSEALLPRLAKAEKEKWIVGIVANLRPVKDIGTFVSAAVALLKSRDDIEFMIVGEGPERYALEQQVEKAGCKEEIKFVGQVNNPLEMLLRFDVAVLTSKSEGLSNAVLEYMAAARPIIVTAVGGNLELIDNDVNGLRFESGDVEDLCRKVELLLDNRSKARAFGQIARDVVIQRFGCRAETDKYIRLLWGEWK